MCARLSVSKTPATPPTAESVCTAQDFSSSRKTSALRITLRCIALAAENARSAASSSSTADWGVCAAMPIAGIAKASASTMAQTRGAAWMRISEIRHLRRSPATVWCPAGTLMTAPTPRVLIGAVAMVSLAIVLAMGLLENRSRQDVLDSAGWFSGAEINSSAYCPCRSHRLSSTTAHSSARRAETRSAQCFSSSTT